MPIPAAISSVIAPQLGGTFHVNNQEPVDPRTGAQAPLRPGGSTSAAPVSTGGSSSAAAATSAAVTQAFAALLAGYNAQQADLDRQKATQEQITGNQYASDKNSLELNFNQGNDNLNRSERKLDYTKANSLRELGTNIGSAFDSRMHAIGSAGGGSSSANLGLALALHGVQGEQQGNLIDQAAIQQGDINQNRTQLKQSHDDAISKLDTWKTNQILQIANNYLTQKASIDRARAGASAQQQQALAQQSTALAQQASAQLASVQSAASIPGVDTGAADAVRDQGLAAMGQYNNYTVSALNGSNPSISYSGGNNGNTGYSLTPSYKKADSIQ